MTAQKDDSNNHVAPNHSDFSIEHILNRAGNSASPSVHCNNCDASSAASSLTLDPYPWLQCTRYCPPKVQRTQKRVGCHKRQLGRHPRIPFTSHQLSVLEKKFQQSPYLSSEEVTMLSRQLHLADVRVKIWFQNRRARERREKTHPTNSKNPEPKETRTSESVSDVSASPVEGSSQSSVYNFFPAQTVLQNHLANYFLPIPQVHYTSKDNCS